MNQFMDIAFPKGPLDYYSEHEEVYRDHAIRVVRFRDEAGTPTLIIPPKAGHGRGLEDFGRGQSLVQTVMANRRGPVYTMEHLPVPATRGMEDLEGMISNIATAVGVAGPARPVHIIGLCQGGWASGCFVALSPGSAASFTPICAPFDFHLADNALHKMVKKLGYSFYEWCVEVNGGIMPGEWMLSGWKSADPVMRYYGDYVDIQTAILAGDARKLEKIKRFRTWWDHTENVPGAAFLEIIKYLFEENRLIKGELKLFGETVDLSKIRCPVVTVGSTGDRITELEQLQALHDSIQPEVPQEAIEIPNAGHIGSFMGTASQAYVGRAVRWANGVCGHRAQIMKGGLA
jgi:poly(3-hydroxyalkanoate) synthetase